MNERINERVGWIGAWVDLYFLRFGPNVEEVSVARTYERTERRKIRAELNPLWLFLVLIDGDGATFFKL